MAKGPTGQGPLARARITDATDADRDYAGPYLSRQTARMED
jgi:hypothetical protein